jgi:hypothetical protein
MGLSNVLALIQADLSATLSTYAPLAGVTFKTGARELRANDAPPRIVWIRLPGQYGPSQQGHGRDPRTTARILRTHVARVEAHVWAVPNASNNNDDSDTELLAHTLVASAYRVARGAFEVLTDEWPQPEWLTDGYLCVVTFEFRIPVTDIAPIPVSMVGPPAIPMPFDQSTIGTKPAGTLQAPGDT